MNQISGDRATSAPPRGGTRPDTLQSVSTALNVLDCFMDEPELGVSEIARRLGIAKSSAHRLLSTLASRRMVEKNPVTGQYRLGVHLCALGNLTQCRLPFVERARPELIRLNQVTGLTAMVGVLDGSDVIYPDVVGDIGLRDRMERAGIRPKAHSTAVGRALAGTDEELAARMRRQSGHATPAQLREFDASVVAFRRSGVAMSTDQGMDGLAALASPFTNLRGEALGAVVVVGSSASVAPCADRIGRLLPPTASRITRLIRAA